MIGSGPFAPNDSLAYDSLKDLLDLVKRDRPQALLLFGPFLDQQNTVIYSGEIYHEEGEKLEFHDYDALFADLVNMVCKELADCSSTEVFLIPSPKDINHIFPLPQPPYPVNLTP